MKLRGPFKIHRHGCLQHHSGNCSEFLAAILIPSAYSFSDMHLHATYVECVWDRFERCYLLFALSWLVVADVHNLVLAMKGSMNYTQTKQKTPDGISYSIVAAGKEDLHIRAFRACCLNMMRQFRSLHSRRVHFVFPLPLVSFSSVLKRYRIPSCLGMGCSNKPNCLSVPWWT